MPASRGMEGAGWQGWSHRSCLRHLSCSRTCWGISSMLSIGEASQQVKNIYVFGWALPGMMCQVQNPAHCWAFCQGQAAQVQQIDELGPSTGKVDTPLPQALVIHRTPGQSQVSAQPGWGLCVDPGFFADLKELPYQDSGATLKFFSPPSVKGSLVPVELKLRIVHLSLQKYLQVWHDGVGNSTEGILCMPIYFKFTSLILAAECLFIL